MVAGAFILVRGASLLALRLGLSPLVVGLTVVAFGTSAPEMAVTTGAVLAGQGGLNLVGRLKADDWNGRRGVQFEIEDVADPRMA